MKFSLNNRSLYEFDKIHGKQPLQVLYSGDYGPQAVIHMMYVGLKTHNPEITLDDAIDLVDFKALNETVPVIIKAIKAAYDIGEDPEDESNDGGEEKEKVKKKTSPS